MRPGLPGSITRVLFAAVAVAAGCDAPPPPDEDPSRVAGSEQAPPSTPAEAPWRTVLSQDEETKSAMPEPFSIEGEEVRVISRLGPAITPLSSGVLVVNLLPAEAIVPIATLRAELVAEDTVYADTTLVDVEPGRFQLYVAHQSGLREWRVTVQERP